MAKTRFLKSVLAEAKSNKVAMPWQRSQSKKTATPKRAAPLRLKRA